MMGALTSFLYFNLFGRTERNTKIFMGDSGSLSLGYTLGFLAIKTMMDNQQIWPYRPECLLIPMTLLLVPTADVVRVTLYRLMHGMHVPMFQADKNHIHHKLMRTGLNQHQTLLVIIGLAVFICWLNYLLYPTLSLTVVAVLDVVVYSIANGIINLMKKDCL